MGRDVRAQPPGAGECRTGRTRPARQAGSRSRKGRMMSDTGLKPARRFLHVCYCCTDAEASTAFFVNQFAMRNTMSTPTEPSDGAILGIEGQVVGAAAFVYDARGPRTSPAIEVQSWVDPPLVGTPVDDPTKAGIQALGLAVTDLDATTERLVALGCSVIGTGTTPFAARWTSIRDLTGVTLDLVEERALPADESWMHHLRITCNDLAASLPWYEGLGFETVDKSSLDDATFLGFNGKAQAEVV